MAAAGRPGDDETDVALAEGRPGDDESDAVPTEGRPGDGAPPTPRDGETDVLPGRPGDDRAGLVEGRPGVTEPGDDVVDWSTREAKLMS